MGKTITSPVKRFSGSVTLADPLTYPQYIAWLDAVEAAGKIKTDGLTVGDIAATPRLTAAMLPGVCACVEQWAIAGLPAVVTPDTFPATPRVSSVRLLVWLIGEISALVSAVDDIPNE